MPESNDEHKKLSQHALEAANTHQPPIPEELTDDVAPLYQAAMTAGRLTAAKSLAEVNIPPQELVDFLAFIRLFEVRSYHTNANIAWGKYRLIDRHFLAEGRAPIIFSSPDVLAQMRPVEDNLNISERFRKTRENEWIERYGSEALILTSLPAVLELPDQTPSFGGIKAVKQITSDLVELYGQDGSGQHA